MYKVILTIGSKTLTTKVANVDNKTLVSLCSELVVEKVANVQNQNNQYENFTRFEIQLVTGGSVTALVFNK